MDVSPLKKLRLFDRLPARALNALAGVMTERNWRAGENIILQGSNSDGVYILLKGEVLVTRKTKTGENITLNTLQSGSVFGTLSTMDGGLRGANCIAKLSKQLR